MLCTATLQTATSALTAEGRLHRPVPRAPKPFALLFTATLQTFFVYKKTENNIRKNIPNNIPKNNRMYTNIYQDIQNTKRIKSNSEVFYLKY